jgi:hypothetical protein
MTSLPDSFFFPNFIQHYATLACYDLHFCRNVYLHLSWEKEKYCARSAQAREEGSGGVLREAWRTSPSLMTRSEMFGFFDHFPLNK